MESKKNNELKDEALESVTGGASCMHDVLTGKWYVFRKDNTLYGEFLSEVAANKAYRELLLQEAEDTKSSEPKPIMPVEPPFSDY